MFFIVRSQDHADKLAVRQEFTADHKAFLAKYTDQILIPGTLFLEEGGAAQGSIWIIKADSKEEVEKICLQDPFRINGLRKSVEIFIWSRVFPDKQVTI
ncbi:YciI family protein [Rhizosphaericola mali]|uniref:YCII-related domain-containing protein n=1 Tax=Rhizosphaericola mali TaxID=2545455 RepID=A0A5P2G9D6_9BACT|nr:YciI family protein [Rhizosphaericola mali]QES88131.1 hypothetical protein E0W69_005445 [Rhizosphaericola mali]